MSNAIIKLADEERSLVSHFGSQDSFNFLMERQAEIYQVPMADVERYPDVRGALVKATQMSWTYGVMPGKHIYLIPFNKKDGNQWRQTYAVADSYEWRKASADAKAQENGWRYMVQSEKMTDEEVKEYITRHSLSGAPHPSDCGYRARVLFWHEIEIVKAMGGKYDPPWHYGFWRKNAQEKGGKWVADNVPSGRTPEWVAMKRAEKSALAQHFELRALGGWNQKSEPQRTAAIQDHITSMLPEPESDHDGAVMYRDYDEDFYDLANEDIPVTHVVVEDEPEMEMSERDKLMIELDELGESYYGTKWPRTKAHNIEKITGSTDGTLTEEQLERLIAGLEKLIKQPA